MKNEIKIFESEKFATPQQRMADIYRRLCELDASGEFYEYYSGHLCDMECFCNLNELLNKSNKRDQYIKLYLAEFNKHITLRLSETNNKLRPDARISSHLTISETHIRKALTKCLSQKKRKYFRKAITYLNQFPATQYYNLTKHKLIGLTPSNIVLNEIDNVDGIDLYISSIRFFNALEILKCDEQKRIISCITELYLEEDCFCSFSEMILEPMNLSHGQIVLAAKIALSLLDKESIENCRSFFRKVDKGTISRFKMDV